MIHQPRQPRLHLRGFTYAQRQMLMPELGFFIDQAGGCVLQRRTLTANALELMVESQLTVLPDVYAAFLGAGVELARDSHRALTQQCLCGQYLHHRRGMPSVVLILMEIQFLDLRTEAFDRVPIYPHASALA